MLMPDRVTSAAESSHAFIVDWNELRSVVCHLFCSRRPSWPGIFTTIGHQCHWSISSNDFPYVDTRPITAHHNRFPAALGLWNITDYRHDHHNVGSSHLGAHWDKQ